MARTSSVRNALLLFTAFTSLTVAAPYAQAQSVTEPGGLGGTWSEVRAISADGSIFTGQSYLAGDVVAHAFRLENGVMTDLGTLGGDFSDAFFISADGSVIAGISNIVGNAANHAFRWENGIMTDIGTLGGTYSITQALSADGSTVIGISAIAGNAEEHGFLWKNNTIQDLGTLGGNQSYAVAVSANGSVVAGHSRIAGNGAQHAFRWENNVMQDLGTLGGLHSNTDAMSADGSVIVGSSFLAGNIAEHAFRWENNIMQDLGTLGGTNSYAYAVSADGSTAVGYSSIAGDMEEHAFRWKNGIMTNLGTLGGTYSYAERVSTDGSVVAGSSNTAGDIEEHAFRWESGIMKDLADILTDAGVGMGNWDYFEDVTAMSADGKVLTGMGYYSGSQRYYIFSMGPTGTDPGVITPDEIVRAASSITAPAQQGHNAITAHTGQSLFVARNAIGTYLSAPKQHRIAMTSAPEQVEPAAGGNTYELPREYNHAFYATGSFGAGQGNNDFGNTVISGNTGLLVKLADDLAVGAGVIASRDKQETYLDGTSRTNAKGGTLTLSSEPDFGMRAYATATVAKLDVDTDRHYMNGGSIDSSSGETDGMAYGAALRLGYSFNTGETTSIMPYGDVEWSRVELDGYTERGGPFPASVSDQKEDNLVTRLGVEVSYDATEDLTLRGRAAWGHDHSNDKDSGVQANISPLSLTLPGNEGDRNWAEGGITALWHASDRATLSADLAGRTGETGAPALNIAVGITYGF